jgi:hypothetical protein
MAVAWAPILIAVVYTTVGRLGFYPNDEGLMQSYTYRILLGQVPHRDFISPRPLGSALLHLVDFAIPGPLFEVSRLMTLAEYSAYAAVFAWLIFRLPPWKWGPLAVVGSATSVLINLNTFPLMSWYTVDGLLLIACGYLIIAVAIRRGSRAAVLVGFLLLGIAALTKQSFIPAPAFGWLLLIPGLRHLSWKARLRDLVITGLIGAVPTIAFLVWISLLGGMQALRAQLLGGAFVYGQPLVESWFFGHDIFALAGLVAAVLALVIPTYLADSRGEARYRLIGIGLRLLLSAVVVGVPLWSQLGISGDEWGTRVFWMLVAFILARSLDYRSPDLIGVALVGAGWMSAISYGYPWPTFVAGSAALYMLARTWSGVDLTVVLPNRLRFAPLIASVLTLILLFAVFVDARQQRVYLDRPASQLTASLNSVSPAFGDIRTNPTTAKYLGDMVECIRRYPARYVAILPENAAMYPALHLRNPFPIDWMWPDDIHGSVDKILATTDRLNQEGDYLVLFQTIGEPDVVGHGILPAASLQSPIFAYTTVPNEIMARLNGTKSTCGTFIVVYSPAPART